MKEISQGNHPNVYGSQAFLSFAQQLTGSEFNSLMLSLFQQRSDRLKPADVAREFQQNRFVKPATIDPIRAKELELCCLRIAQQQHFSPILLSPLSPLGTSSVVGEVNQNNVVSALRGTEVVSDATNVMALKIATDWKNNATSETVRYATTHRHVRAQAFTNPDFSAHFGIFCLVSGGLDQGNFQFEAAELCKHARVYFALLTEQLDEKDVVFKIYLRNPNPVLRQQVEKHVQAEPFSYEIIEDFQAGDYYQTLQFKLFIQRNDTESQLIDIVDGGVVNWTQKLIPNQKHRLFISGCGLDLLEKLGNQQ